jgi:hypothetical protein
MGADRYPHKVLFSLMHDASAALRRAPHVSWEEGVMGDLQDLQDPINMHSLKGMCELRGSWRCMLYKLPG